MSRYIDCIDMMEILRALSPLPRTIANNATDEAFDIIKKYLPGSVTHQFTTGSKAWTWTIPKRWELLRATIKSGGQVLVDSDWSILHVVNYSKPVLGKFSRDELLKHIYTLPEQPDSIPFIFSFYQDQWGFSIPHNWLKKFDAEHYEVEINSKLEDGFLNCITFFIPGESEETFIISSNICHPLQANDSLTGVVVALDIAARLKKRKKLKYSYLVMIVPETIGTIAFLSANPQIIENSVGAFFSEMLGTNTPLVWQKTRMGNTYWDSILTNICLHATPSIKTVDFLKSAANDEKVLDSPGVEIPTVSLTRYPYKEYHTNHDNYDLINELKLKEARDFLQQFIDYFERDYIPKLVYPGPIFLSGYDLYPDWKNTPDLKPLWDSFIDVMYSINGVHSVVELACKKNIPIEHFFYWTDKFFEKGLIQKKDFICTKKISNKP